MSALQAFHYRLPHRIGGLRPGSHPGSSLGAGQEFISHARFYDRPDPRRLDLRASLRNPGGDWLVRVNRQRTSIPVQVIADVSASMRFGSRQTKLEVAAQFVESLGQSAFLVGDALGMRAFDAREREDLFMPPLMGRGVGRTLASMLRQCESRPGGIEGLRDTALQLSGRRGLVFLVSDFHWPLDSLGTVLDSLAHAWVVPMVLWDPAEIEPPADNALAALRDAETGVRRTLWLRPKLREQWRETVARRREQIESIFAARSIRPFYVYGAFDGDALSKYFFEAAA